MIAISTRISSNGHHIDKVFFIYCMECFLLLIFSNTICIGIHANNGITKLIAFHRQRQNFDLMHANTRLSSQQQDDRKQQNQQQFTVVVKPPIIRGLDDYVPLFHKAKKLNNTTTLLHYEFSFAEHGRLF
jgi:hypothetical protein